MHESNSTCNQRFAKVGIPQDVETRRAYRELLITTPCLGECISGTILYDETIRQQERLGEHFVKVILDAGVIPGIKVDTGAKDMAAYPGEKITEGLDHLRDRLKDYFQNGRSLRQVARRDHDCGWHTHHWLHRRERERPGSLCRVVPRGRTGSRG